MYQPSALLIEKLKYKDDRPCFCCFTFDVENLDNYQIGGKVTFYVITRQDHYGNI